MSDNDKALRTIDNGNEVRNDDDVREMIRNADTIEEAIGLSIGAASACWDSLMDAGEFNSTRALAIHEELLDLVRGYVR